MPNLLLAYLTVHYSAVVLVRLHKMCFYMWQDIYFLICWQFSFFLQQIFRSFSRGLLNAMFGGCIHNHWGLDICWPGGPGYFLAKWLSIFLTMKVQSRILFFTSSPFPWISDDRILSLDLCLPASICSEHVSYTSHLALGAWSCSPSLLDYLSQWASLTKTISL